MTRGGCLCGAVRFEVGEPAAREGESPSAGAFELCHCTRCRKASGSAFAAGLAVPSDALRWTRGRDRVVHYEAPVLERPPAYERWFCRHCGAPVPPLRSRGPWTEIPAGSLDDDPGRRPERHIFAAHAPPWLPLADDGLPRPGAAELAALRRGSGRRRAGA